jgi:thioredoxin-related protein
VTPARRFRAPDTNLAQAAVESHRGGHFLRTCAKCGFARISGVKNFVLTAIAVVGLGAILMATQKEKQEAQPQISQVVSQPENRWLTDYKKAQEEAKSSNRFLLMEFTGSDWCGPCILLQREVFSSPEFQDYAKKNFVLLEVDFPRTKTLPQEVVVQNQELAYRYGISVFPSAIILNGEGKKVGELLGYDPGGGSKGYIEELEKARKR